MTYDDQTTIRDEARFIAKKHGFILDFQSFYREVLNRKSSPGVILGLGEVGNNQDYDIVKKYYDYDDSKIRIAAMVAMWGLNKDRTVNLVMANIDSDHFRIRKTARKLLRKAHMPTILFEIRNRLNSADMEFQEYALDVIFSYGGWMALEGILYILSSMKEGTVYNKANELLIKWILRSAALYAKPDASTLSKIKSYIGTIKQSQPTHNKTLAEIEFMILTRR